jgi:hypothetical protein
MSVFNPPIKDVDFNTIDYSSVNTDIITPAEADARYTSNDTEPSYIITGDIYTDPIYMGTGSGSGVETERDVIKKVRIIRIEESTGATGSNKDLVSVEELQVWVGGVNIALTGTATASSTFATFSPSDIIDGDFSTRGIAGAGGSTNIGEFLLLTLTSAISINELQSVVYYMGANSSNSIKRNSGLQLQLLDTNDTILYASIVFGSDNNGAVGNLQFCRIDGGSLPVTNLSSVPTHTNIIDPLPTTILKVLLPVDTAPANIQRVRLVRKADSNPPTPYSSENLIVTEEIQIWIGGINIAADLPAGNATMNNPFTNLPQYDAAKAIDDVVGNNSLKAMCGDSNDTNINDFISINLSSKISVTDIESIVHFADDSVLTQRERQKGLVLQLLDAANNVLYQTAQFPVTNGTESYYRWDGCRLPLEYFTTFSSTAVKTRIIESATANENEIFKIPAYFATPVNTGCIGIGINCGNIAQEQNSIAIGHSAQETSAAESCIAMGVDAGKDYQGQYGLSGADDGVGRSIALGKLSGKLLQRDLSIALGYLAGEEDQGIDPLGLKNGGAIAIGRAAGRYNQGNSSIAIGKWASYGLQGSSSAPSKPNTINFASPSPIGSSATANANATYFENIRFIDEDDAGMAALGFRRLHYDTASKALRYYQP